MIDFLGFIIVKALSFILSGVPLGLALWIGRRGGDFACFVNSKRRAIAYANLKSAFPEKDAAEIKKILKAHYENLGMSVIELLKLSAMGKGYLDRYVKMNGVKNIDEAIQGGKGLIFLTAHFGNWEVASLAVSSRGYTMSVFAREQKYTRLNDILNKNREMTGCKVVTKGFSVRGIIKTLKDNGMIGMLGDQDAGANGVFVDFLNRPASFAPGAVIFSLKTGAITLPSFIRRIGNSEHLVEMNEPLELIDTGERDKDVKENLKAISRIMEDHIKRFPDQWLWSHKRWKSTPQRTVLVLSDGKAGHLNQAMAVADMVKEALGSRLKARGIEEKPIVKIEVVEINFKNRLMRIFLDLASVFSGKRCQGCMRCVRFCLRKDTFDQIKNKYADIIISCGASTVGVNSFLKYENNAKVIAIMKPGLGRSKKFNVIILPRHDVPLTLALSPRRRGNHILVTETAPNRLKAEGLRLKGIGLLIGGDAKDFRLQKETVEKAIDAILKIASEIDYDIFATTSRRTSIEIDKSVKDKLSNNKRCKLLVIANEKNKTGAVQEIISQSEVVIVSPESISMISEAVSSGRYVIVFKNESRETKYEIRNTKYEKSLMNLEMQDFIKTATVDEIYDAIKTLLTRRPPIRELGDREKIIKKLEDII